ncbi:MAG: MFS transporter [Prevotella sp.]|nr:MFS transporter [Prevotella sp.]
MNTNVKNSDSVMSKYRWSIAALLLFSTTVNYMDRNVIGYLKDYFCDPNGFGWTSTDYSILTSVFTAFYAGFTLIVGFLIDKIGTKLGLAASLIVWSIAGFFSAAAGKSLGAQLAARGLFGAGEAGNFPASIKTVAEWFPKKERALATGIFNSGSNVGAMICALIIPPILAAWNPNVGNHLFLGVLHGWQMAFIITSVIGFIWLIFWHKMYASPADMLKKGKINKEEFDYINSDDEPVKEEVKAEAVAPAKKMPWYHMLCYRQTWSFVMGKFMTDGIWWFLLFWLPTYIKQQFCAGMSPDDTKYTVMISTFVVFGIAIIGSVYGGALPMSFINKGWATYKARMTSLLIIGFFPLLLIFTQTVAKFDGMTGLVAAVAVISIAGAAHQAFSANLFTTVSDMFPKKAVGSVTGIGAAAGGLGGVFVQITAGRLEDFYRATNNGDVSPAYAIMFGVCAFAYLVAWLFMKVLVPKYKPIVMD